MWKDFLQSHQIKIETDNLIQLRYRGLKGDTESLWGFNFSTGEEGLFPSQYVVEETIDI